MGRSSTTDWGVDPDHIAERAGLFIIIALGESVILIGATFANANTWDFATSTRSPAPFSARGNVVGVFRWVAEDAHHTFARHADPGRLARAAYTYAHIPIVAGIVLTAVGNELLLAHPTGHADQTMILILVGGPALSCSAAPGSTRCFAERRLGRTSWVLPC